MSEPTNEAVDNFVAVTGLPVSNARRWLKAHTNDVNASVNAWMDGGMAALPPPPPIPSLIAKDSYSERQFRVDQSGENAQAYSEPSVSWKTETQTFVTASHEKSVPPTRPSSRNGTISYDPGQGLDQTSDLGPRIFGDQIELAKEQSLRNSNSLSNERELALPVSQFGPATRDTYDQDNWAITIPDIDAQEILLSPVATDRKRAPGEPAFLKPTIQPASSFAALLKILHEIPISREALLNRGILLGDYGRDEEWWDGRAIKNSHVISTEDTEASMQLRDIIYETQRLMAFLDSTNRAYGSVDGLLKRLQAVTQVRQSHDIIPDFLSSWSSGTKNSSDNKDLAQIFTSVGVRRTTHDGASTSEVEPFHTLSLRVDSAIAGRGHSLYGAIDELMWLPDETCDTFLQTVGDILIIDVENTCSQVPGLGISIPATWFVGRYLEAALPDVKKILAQRGAIEQEVKEMEKMQAKLMVHKPLDQGGEDINIEVLMTALMQYFQQTSEYQRSEPDKRQDISLGDTAKTMEGLSQVMQSLLQKAQDFEEIKTNVAHRLREASQFPAHEDSASREELRGKFTLRGIVVNPEVFFVVCGQNTVKETADPNLADSQVGRHIVSEDCGKDSDGQKWWRIEFSAAYAQPSKVSQVSESEALAATSSETSRAVLVYASDRALNYPVDVAPPALRNFVRADNVLFNAELAASQAVEDVGLQPMVEGQPGTIVGNSIQASESMTERFDTSAGLNGERLAGQQKRKISLYNADLDMASQPPSRNAPSENAQSDSAPPHSEALKLGNPPHMDLLASTNPWLDSYSANQTINGANSSQPENEMQEVITPTSGPFALQSAVLGLSTTASESPSQIDPKTDTMDIEMDSTAHAT